ncbi:AzlC family ABC transporter permease [Yinghuangia seranimata]|uniref:AzlC family ABC transporter permease n=1 Tax=Yinghuangia seranimata TaxID=408067 RepID=UPI003CCFD3F0
MRSIWRTPSWAPWHTLDRATVRDIALVCVADALVGASFGAIAVSGGLAWWIPVAMSVLVFAGGAQFAAVGVVLSGGGPAAAVATGLVLNTRLLAFGFAVSDTLGRGPLRRVIGAHLTTDENVAFALQETDPARRRAVFWTCGIALFTAWNLAVVAGAAAGSAIGDTDALGLDAAFPAVLLALVWPTLAAEPATRRAALAGAAVSLAAAPFLPAGVPVLLALSGLALALGRRAPGKDQAAAPASDAPEPAARDAETPRPHTPAEPEALPASSPAQAPPPTLQPGRATPATQSAPPAPPAPLAPSASPRKAR